MFILSQHFRFLSKAAVWFVAGFSALVLSGEGRTEELAVVANKVFPVHRLNETELRDIFLGEKTMERSVRIIPVDQQDPEIKEEFLRRIVSKNILEYDSYWFKKAFQDGIVPPVKVGNSREVIFFLQREIGAIGYVWAGEIEEDSGLKVILKIDVGER